MSFTVEILCRLVFLFFYFFDKAAVCIGKADPEKQKNQQTNKGDRKEDYLHILSKCPGGMCLVAFPVDNFAESVFPVPKTNK